MQFTKQTILALAATLASVSGQLGGLPTCALTPATTVLGSSSCGLTNVTCICSNQQLLAQLEGAVQQACTNPADLSSALGAASSLCARASVTLQTGSATGVSSPVTTPASSVLASASSALASALSTLSATNIPLGPGPVSVSHNTTAGVAMSTAGVVGGGGTSAPTNIGSVVTTGTQAASASSASVASASSASAARASSTSVSTAVAAVLGAGAGVTGLMAAVGAFLMAL